MTKYKSSLPLQRLSFYNMPSFSDLDRAKLFAFYFHNHFLDENLPEFDRDHGRAVGEWYQSFYFEFTEQDTSTTVRS